MLPMEKAKSKVDQRRHKRLGFFTKRFFTQLCKYPIAPGVEHLAESFLLVLTRATQKVRQRLASPTSTKIFFFCKNRLLDRYEQTSIIVTSSIGPQNEFPL